MPVDAFATLSGRLCPWLDEPLRALESAYGRERLGHAWLIAGPEGLGKLNLALVFADRVLRGRVGSGEPRALSVADAVEAMAARHAPADRHPDLHWIFPEEDKRSIGIEQVRDVGDALALKAFGGRAKVVVIEPAQAMTGAAANALLKTLEEPSADTYLLLIAHQPGRLPSTIRSRCQTLLVRGPAASAAPEAGSFPGSRSSLAPLAAARRSGDGYSGFINMLEESLNLVCTDKRDPLAVADEWLGQDLAAVLDWLVARLHGAIRARAQGRASTAVTEGGATLLHTFPAAPTLAALFEQLAAAERLRDRLGGGINAELALRALVQRFAPERGRT